MLLARGATPMMRSARDVSARAGYARPAPLAREYHERDYDYDEHLAQVAPLLKLQREAAARVPAAQRAVLPPPLPPLHHDEHEHEEDDEDAATTTTKDNAWEAFFREHSTARFFRERRYFPLAFPVLTQATSVLEIGAGAGAALLPVLRANQTCARVVATDVSASSLAQLRRCAREALGAEEADRRVVTAVADGAAEPGAFFASVERGLLLQQRQRRERRKNDGRRPEGGEQGEDDDTNDDDDNDDENNAPPTTTKVRGAFDAVILAFTLSAVPPGAPMRRMLRNAALCLKPGTGVLCLRDHARGDLVQLRIPPEQVLLPSLSDAHQQPHPQHHHYENTYVRGDGTLAHFFSLEELAAMAAGAGFEAAAGAGRGDGEEEEEEDGAEGRRPDARVACVINRNRRTGQELRRAFVTATFWRRRRRAGEGGEDEGEDEGETEEDGN